MTRPSLTLALVLAVSVALGCGAPVRSPSAAPSPWEPSQPRGIAPEGFQTPARTKPLAMAPPAVAPPKSHAAGAVSAASIATVLQEVAAARGLPVRRPVVGSELDRDAVIKRIMAKVERDLPPHVLRAQGELLAAFGLVPPDYDFVAGIYGLLKDNVAGFYDPDDGTMVLLADLDEQNSRDTLVHELEHALQDQHYQLEPLLRFRPHDSDRVAAVQVLSEGDAVSLMFDVVSGSAFAVPESALRLALTASTAFTGQGPDTPRLLHLALVAPYLDGFAFVQELRRRGDWPAVDGAWQSLPTTTEQLLHVDKFDAREPSLEIGVPALQPLGAGWSVVDHDVLGEQGLRIALEIWTDAKRARTAAAGWGGDRYLVASRAAPPSGNEPAATEQVAAWVVRFDSQRDAAELADVLRAALGLKCVERPALGAMRWAVRGDVVTIAAGPFRRGADGKRLAADAGCTTLQRWERELIAAARGPAHREP